MTLFSTGSDAQPPRFGQSASRHPYGWLLIWFGIALIIRLTYLASKPPWMDEVATTLFSLGNYSRLIPLNEVIDLDTVLRPLQITPGATAQDVVVNLLREDNHPPSYFVLAHWWMRFFHGIRGSGDGYASLWAERSLSVFFGALAVPFMYGTAQVCFRQRRLSMICAALMALSPFAVYLSQEARSYSLAILLNVVSIGCFVIAAYAICGYRKLTWRTVLLWVGVNAVGVSVHYFFGLSALAQGLALLVLLMQQTRRQQAGWRPTSWFKVGVAAVGTFVGAAVWLPVLTNFYGSPQSSFLRAESVNWQYFVNPLVQSLAGWLYAVMSPVTNGNVPIIVVSCVVLLLGYVPWIAVIGTRSLRFQLKQGEQRTGIEILGIFLGVANGLFLLICYGLGFDITRGHRYSFVFFPSILMLVSYAIAPFWPDQSDEETSNIRTSNTHGPFKNFSQIKLPFISKRISGKTLVQVVLGVAFLGSQAIVFNYSSLKFYKADLFINYVQEKSTLPVVIGTSTLITEQPIVIGIEIMSIGWEIQRSFAPDEPASNWTKPPRFLLMENNLALHNSPEQLLKEQLQAMPEAIDLWILGGSGESLKELGSRANLNDVNCQVAPAGTGNRGSFSYTHYVCQSR